MVYYLQSLVSSAVLLDIAQGGFRPQRSTFDQTLCLDGICNIYTKIHSQTPILALLDIHSAYDVMDRQVIWQTLQVSNTPLHLSHFFNTYHCK
ncbi:hypothetical protein BJV82DRAFT_510787 [Fennellomyces sp. T-0311]|nr:hypothetical protein BJV82DRAFT_510787 [Fennellomyces sp. T-0311]